MGEGDRTIVAVDLDDTLVDFTGRFLTWHNARYGTGLSVEDLAEAKYLFEAWGGTAEQATERVAEFFGEADLLRQAPLPGAVDCLRRLGSGYRLVVLSARDPAYEPATAAWIDTYLAGVFDTVILGIGHSERGERSVTKADVCRRIGAAVLIDDQVAHLAGAAENGVRTLLFGRYPWNRSQPVPPGTVRVGDWPQVCTALT